MIIITGKRGCSLPQMILTDLSVSGQAFLVSFPQSFNIIAHSSFPSQFRPSCFSSAFQFGIKNYFCRSLLVHSNHMISPFLPTYWHKGYDNHVLIQSIQFIIVPNPPLIVVFDWAIYGPQNFSPKNRKMFFIRCRYYPCLPCVCQDWPN